MAKFSVTIQQDSYKNLINNTLGNPEVARKFVAEISTLVGNNVALQNCDAGSILSAGLLAQTLDLPLAPTLGFAYIVPYKQGGVAKAQFIVGYKGLVQLALRSTQFERLGVREVHEGEYVGLDEFGEDTFKFSHDYDDNEVVGYYAYFVLNNGFKKTLYMTKKQVEKHASKYSMAYRSGGNGKSSLWHDQFDLMACKTVLKLLLNRYAPLSVDMQKAVQADQAVIREDGTYEYVDNEPVKTGTGKTNVNIDIIPESEKPATADENGVIDEDDKPF